MLSLPYHVFLGNGARNSLYCYLSPQKALVLDTLKFFRTSSTPTTYKNLLFLWEAAGCVASESWGRVGAGHMHLRDIDAFCLARVGIKHGSQAAHLLNQRFTPEKHFLNYCGF